MINANWLEAVPQLFFRPFGAGFRPLALHWLCMAEQDTERVQRRTAFIDLPVSQT